MALVRERTVVTKRPLLVAEFTVSGASAYWQQMDDKIYFQNGRHDAECKMSDLRVNQR
jgi:hypothetical protein